MRRGLNLLGPLILATGWMLWWLPALSDGFAHASAPDPNPAKASPVYHIPVEGVIDLGLSAFLRRSLEEAQAEGATAIVLEINTLGGRVDAALEIRDALFAVHDMATVAFVNRRAISAGALISLAAETIIMAPASTMGAATPVMLAPGSQESQPTGEKEMSFVRSEFRATAQRNGYPPLLAEAMVDPDIEVLAVDHHGQMVFLTPEEMEQRKAELGKEAISQAKTVSAKGKLLTLTAEEATRYFLASGQASTVEEVLTLCNLPLSPLVFAAPTWSENFVRFLTHPIVSGLLLSAGSLALIFELINPGWGIGGTIGVILLALFFGAHLLVGLANWTEVLLFCIGIILLTAEIFLIPGFGIAGVAGLSCMALAIYFALVIHPLPRFSWDYSLLHKAFHVFLWAIVSGTVLVLALWRFLPQIKMWDKIMLMQEERAEEGFTAFSHGLKTLQGQRGHSMTPLRPAGKVTIGEEIYDALTQGEFIPAEKEVVVVKVEGGHIFVRMVKADSQSA